MANTRTGSELPRPAWRLASGHDIVVEGCRFLRRNHHHNEKPNTILIAAIYMGPSCAGNQLFNLNRQNKSSTNGRLGRVACATLAFGRSVKMPQLQSESTHHTIHYLLMSLTGPELLPKRRTTGKAGRAARCRVRRVAPVRAKAYSMVG